MSNQSSCFFRYETDNQVPFQTYQRITASRVFYVFDNSLHYVRCRPVGSKAESLEAERNVIDELNSRGFEIKSSFNLFHPILFFSCVPDVIIQKDK